MLTIFISYFHPVSMKIRAFLSERRVERAVVYPEWFGSYCVDLHTLLNLILFGLGYS